MMFSIPDSARMARHQLSCNRVLGFPRSGHGGHSASVSKAASNDRNLPEVRRDANHSRFGEFPCDISRPQKETCLGSVHFGKELSALFMAWLAQLHFSNHRALC